MSKLHMRFYGPLDGAGGTGGDNANADEAGGKTTDPNADAGKSDDLTPEQKLEKLEGEHASLTTKHADLEKARAVLATSLGRQSEQVGILKEFQESLKNPASAQGMLTKMAETAGLKVSFGQSAQEDLVKLLASDDPKDKLKVMRTVAKEEAGTANPQHAADVEQLKQTVLAAQFDDWEDRSEVRAGIAASMTLGKMSTDEVHHMAARGMAMADVVKEAEARGAEKYRLELEKKNQEQVDSGGGRKPTPADTEGDAIYFRTVLHAGTTAMRPR